MRVIHARNVHEALPEGMYQLYNSGEVRGSRNGPVRVLRDPVTTVYQMPRERVLFWKEREANPFFHLMESLWMLGGRNDVDYPASFLPSMRRFSDDGKTFRGAYGHRWRVFFGYDQLQVLSKLLREKPTTRRAVLQMWDADDLNRADDSKDIPCNTQAYFSRDGDVLDMTVTNRSNDIIWGAYGANAVHFSMLQEVLATSIDCEVGKYWHMTNNFHAYKDVFEKMWPLVNLAADVFAGKHPCPYETEMVRPFPVVNTPIDEWFGDLGMFLDEGPVLGLKDPFFRHVATPMFLAYRTYQESRGRERYEVPIGILERCKASDWRKAGTEWFLRRLEKFNRAEDDGVSHE